MSKEIETKLMELEMLTEKMNVPIFRTRSVGWLSRNLGMQNSKHPNYDKAMKLVMELRRMGVA